MASDSSGGSISGRAGPFPRLNLTSLCARRELDGRRGDRRSRAMRDAVRLGGQTEFFVSEKSIFEL